MILLAQVAGSVSVPWPVLLFVSGLLASTLAWFLLRYISQVDAAQKACDLRAAEHAKELAALRADHDSPRARFDGSRQTDAVLTKLVDHLTRPERADLAHPKEP